MRSYTNCVLFGISLSLVSCSALAANVSGEFDFLKDFDHQPLVWKPETPEPEFPSEFENPVKVDLGPFYNEFEKDRLVTIYLGYGIGTYHPKRGAQVFEMLKLLANHYELSVTEWNLSTDGNFISFLNSKTGIRYKITIGFERNDYIRAYSDYEIVMYHGHSRYGQGPAFQSYQNYFRMGRQFPAVEVDTRNTYFRNEPIYYTYYYPIYYADFGSKYLPYQYRGNRDYRSKLPETSYTKNILGGDVDWVNTKFLSGRQIFYYYSCSNRQYWSESIRSLFPNPQQKLVFGTYKIGRGATEPEALMIASLLKQTRPSEEIVDMLNKTKDCKKCFTAY